MENKENANKGEWQFYPIKIVAAHEILDEIINPMLEKDCKDGKGLFANITTTPIEDVSEDDFAMVEAYGCKASLIPYIDDLKRFKVIGQGDNKGMLSQEFKRFILENIKHLATYVKDHTDTPIKVKNEITTIIKGIDEKPIWGLIFQILILQGLCAWIESIKFNENDYGINEAQSLYNWLCKFLYEKLVNFCCTPYGKNDKEILKPLCEYLYSTQLGQLVQQQLLGDKSSLTGDQNSTDGTTIPQEVQNSDRANLNMLTERAEKYFTLAIEQGFMERTQDGHYKWLYCNGKIASLAYFLIKVYNPDGYSVIPYKRLEQLFGVKYLAQQTSQIIGKHPKWCEPIDNLFDD